MAKTIFSPSQLKAITNEITAVVPPGHTNAVVGIVDTTGVQVLATVKLKGDRWQVMVAGRHDWTGDTNAAAAVVYSW